VLIVNLIVMDILGLFGPPKELFEQRDRFRERAKAVGLRTENWQRNLKTSDADELYECENAPEYDEILEQFKLLYVRT
jgi:hypothetical protein